VLHAMAGGPIVMRNLVCLDWISMQTESIGIGESWGHSWEGVPIETCNITMMQCEI